MRARDTRDRSVTRDRRDEPGTLEQISAVFFSDLWHVALADDHDMELGWHDSEPSSWVAQCMACLEYLATVLIGEDGKAYAAPEVNGQVAGIGCPGTPQTLAALRRPTFDQDFGNQLALEAMERDVSGVARGSATFVWQRDCEESDTFDSQWSFDVPYTGRE